MCTNSVFFYLLSWYVCYCYLLLALSCVFFQRKELLDERHMVILNIECIYIYVVLIVAVAMVITTSLSVCLVSKQYT